MAQELTAIIARVEAMERCFDAVQAAMEKDAAAAGQSSVFHALVRQLRRYYEGGQWLADFAADEAGLLPATLKRGVLSEDGVYDFLAAYSRLTKGQ